MATTNLGRIEYLKTHTALNHMFTLLHKRNSDQRMPNLDVELHRINIELCRYGLARIPVEERVCSHCYEVEDESHVLMYCPLYDDIREQLTLSINDINPSLQDSSVQDQFIQLMSKAICYILNKR